MEVGFTSVFCSQEMSKSITNDQEERLQKPFEPKLMSESYFCNDAFSTLMCKME